MDKGDLLPISFQRNLVKLVKNDMMSLGWGKSRFLIDGYPRSRENIEYWDEIMGDVTNTGGVLWFNRSVEEIDHSEEEMLDRVLNRHKDRSDQNHEVFKRRSDIFQRKKPKILEELQQKKIDVYEVDTNGTIQEAFGRVCVQFEKI